MGLPANTRHAQIVDTLRGIVDKAASELGLASGRAAIAADPQISPATCSSAEIPAARAGADGSGCSEVGGRVGQGATAVPCAAERAVEMLHECAAALEQEAALRGAIQEALSLDSTPAQIKVSKLLAATSAPRSLVPAKSTWKVMH